VSAVRALRSWFARERNRAYLYRVLTAGGTVVLFYGLATQEEVAVWSGLVATGFGLPAANTTTKED
jgi:hypothetical protein